MGKDVAALIVVGVIAGAGLVFGLVAGVARPQEVAGHQTLVQYEHASYCPPAAIEESNEVDSTIALTSTRSEAVDVGVSFLAGGLQLHPGMLALKKVPASSSGSGLDVVGFGGALPIAGLFHYSSPVNGVAATECTPDTGSRWYVPSATTALATKDRLIIYNPFPNDAAVRVTFFTTKGEQPSANLNNVGIRARSTKVIPLERFAKPADTLGVGLEAIRGRIAVWSSVLYSQHPGLQPGATLLPGTPLPKTTWYVPGGSSGDSSTESITVLNPTQKEADVSLSLIGNKGPIQVPKLVSVHIAPRSIQAFDIASFLGGKNSKPGGIAAIVRSGNQVPVVVGSTTFYDGSTRQGADALPGVTAPAKAQVVQPPVSSGSPDNLILVNPSARAATATISFAPQQGKAPSALKNLKVKGGTRKSIDLSRVTKGAQVAVVVRSTRALLAERTAYQKSVGDVSSVVGTPVSATP